jgi:hypothetical protein
MKLVMYIGNDLIEAVGNFKRVLKLKYKDLISQVPEPPEFFVVDPAPRPQPTART